MTRCALQYPQGIHGFGRCSMTAGAMILGMVPMALGVGEGGEQNAPLGRAVIGGLLFATFATLILVPTMYRLLRRQPTAVTDFDVEGRANAIA